MCDQDVGEVGQRFRRPPWDRWKGGCLGSLMRLAAVARKGRWLLGFRLFRVKGVSIVVRD